MPNNRIYAPYANMRLVDCYHALIAWLAERRTDIRDVVIIGMSLDDPAITPSENCRYDLGVAFPQQPGGILGDIVRARRGKAPSPTSIAPGIISTASGCLRAPSNRPTCRQWKCSYAFRRK